MGRAPAALLASVVVLLGLCTVPAVALVVVTDLHSGNVRELFSYAVPAIVGYPLAVVLWLHTRRVAAAGWAWLLAALGVVLVVAVSIAPVGGVAYLFYLEWLEYQPGGRGYHP